MAKFLTLNTHSWMEEEQETKLNQLAESILQEKYDVICLQEVNQLVESEQVVQAPFYYAVDGAIPIHQDHYALRLVEKLAEAGLDYYWSWAYNHIGFDIYNEGVAILSRKPLKARELLVSEVNDPSDYHTRKVFLAETELDGQSITVASCHLSWWDKGFQEEWARFEAVLKELNKPLLLAGDFNNPAGQEGYQAILASPLDLQDAFEVAKERSGSYTVPPEIDGWKGNTEPLRIDYVFTSKDIQVERLQVVFDGKQSAQVSDHYGLQAELSWKD